MKSIFDSDFFKLLTAFAILIALGAAVLILWGQSGSNISPYAQPQSSLKMPAGFC